MSNNNEAAAPEMNNASAGDAGTAAFMNNDDYATPERDTTTPSTAGKKRKKPSSSELEKAYLTVECYEENDNAKPFMKQAIVVNLPSEVSARDTVREAIEKYRPDYRYADSNISSFTTGRGTSLEGDFMNEPIDALQHLLEDGEKWHLIVTMDKGATSLRGDSFSVLSNKLVSDIFCFVGDASTLLACERICHRFKRILSNDTVWKNCKGAEDGREDLSHRENALITSAFRNARMEQKSAKNIILSAFSPALIEKFVNDRKILEMMGSTSPIHYHIRGDALGYALAMIESILISMLKFSCYAAAHAAFESERYPEVTIEDLSLANRACGIFNSAIRDAFNDTYIDMTCIQDAVEKHCKKTRFQFARRIAFRAGIVKISHAAMKQIVIDFFMLLMRLLHRPLIIHHHRSKDCKQVHFESEDDIDLWNDIPPNWEEDGVEHCVIVPGQIEESARELGMLSGCYGSSWVLSQGKELEEEMAEARARYMIDLVKEEYDSLCDSDDFESHSETTEDIGDYSDYNDDECDDDEWPTEVSSSSEEEDEEEDDDCNNTEDDKEEEEEEEDDKEDDSAS